MEGEARVRKRRMKNGGGGVVSSRSSHSISSSLRLCALTIRCRSRKTTSQDEGELRGQAGDLADSRPVRNK